MAEIYTLLTPVITAVTFSKNPCSINEKVVITITVVEQDIVLEPEIIYAGEIYVGER